MKFRMEKSNQGGSYLQPIAMKVEEWVEMCVAVAEFEEGRERSVEYIAHRVWNAVKSGYGSSRAYPFSDMDGQLAERIFQVFDELAWAMTDHFRSGVYAEDVVFKLTDGEIKALVVNGVVIKNDELIERMSVRK